MPNRSPVVSLLVIFAALATVQAKGPFNLEILRRDGYGSVPLSLRDNEFTLAATVNGEKLRLILDTGFDGPVGLDSHMANVKIPTEGKAVSSQALSGKAIESHRGRAQTVTMGNLQITDVPVEIGAYTQLSQGHAETFSNRWDFDTNMGSAAASAGLIGRDFLHTNHAVIDMGNRT